MKPLLTTILSFLVILQAFCQNSFCDTHFKTEYDSAKEVYVKNTREDIVIKKDEKNKLIISLIALERTIILSIVVTGAGDCVDEVSKVAVVFRDGSKLELTNNGGFNCDAELSVFFGGDFGHKKELGVLMSKEIQILKVTTRKSTIDKARSNMVEVTATPDQSRMLMESIVCLTN